MRWNTATHPDRVTALVLANVAASGGIVKDDERRELLLEMVENHWGEGHFITLFAPRRTGDPRSADSWTWFDRSCMNPAIARQLIELNARIEI